MVYFHFDDIIKVDRVDVDGKKYDKVSRIEAHSEELKMQLQLDVNTELCHVRVGNKFRMILADTLNEDGSAGLPEGKQKSLADKFEYVMHGLLYQISEDDKSGSGLEKWQDMAKGLIWATAEDLAKNRSRVLSVYRQILRSLNSPALPLNLAARLSKKAEVHGIFVLASDERALHNVNDLIDTAEYSLVLLRKGHIPKYIQ